MTKRKSKSRPRPQASSTSTRTTDLLALDEAFARGDYASVITMRDRILADKDDPLTTEAQAAYCSLELDPGILKLSVVVFVMYIIGWVVALI